MSLYVVSDLSCMTWCTNDILLLLYWDFSYLCNEHLWTKMFALLFTSFLSFISRSLEPLYCTLYFILFCLKCPMYALTIEQHCTLLIKIKGEMGLKNWLCAPFCCMRIQVPQIMSLPQLFGSVLCTFCSHCSPSFHAVHIFLLCWLHVIQHTKFCVITIIRRSHH